MRISQPRPRRLHSSHSNLRNTVGMMITVAAQMAANIIESMTVTTVQIRSNGCLLAPRLLLRLAWHTTPADAKEKKALNNASRRWRVLIFHR